MVKRNTVQTTPSSTLRRLTITGIVVYVAIDVLLAVLRPDYSLLHNAESDYGRGAYFWLMDANFLLRCAFSLTLLLALLKSFSTMRRLNRAGTWLAIWAIASGLLAFFADNPYGYPKLSSGNIHLLLAFVAFVAAAVAMILFSLLSREMKLTQSMTNLSWSLTAIAIVSLFLLHQAAFNPHSLGGLYERIFLTAVIAWEGALALSLKPRHP